MNVNENTYIPVDVLRSLEPLCCENGAELMIDTGKVRFWLVRAFNRVKIEVFEGNTWDLRHEYQDSDLCAVKK